MKCVVRVDGVEEAVGCANDNDNAYGLSAAVFGGDAGCALAVAQRVESGVCHVRRLPRIPDVAKLDVGLLSGSADWREGEAMERSRFSEEQIAYARACPSRARPSSMSVGRLACRRLRITRGR